MESRKMVLMSLFAGQQWRRLEKAMAPHSSTLAWKIPWMEEPCRLQSMGSQSQTTERLHFHFSLSCIGEGNGNPLQCSCLENPRDRVAWWAAIYGVAQSQTWLKRLSSSIPLTALWGIIFKGEETNIHKCCKTRNQWVKGIGWCCPVW